jgi:hypothetical protein
MTGHSAGERYNKHHLGLNGGLGPMWRPRFHGRRVVPLAEGMMELRFGSHQHCTPVRPRRSCALRAEVVSLPPSRRAATKGHAVGIGSP